jgi:hypothetical protein
MEMMPGSVNQKLETPVLYFYTDHAQDVQVQVGFDQGVVSQWYPAAASFLPAFGAMQSVSGGSMSWKAQLVPGMGGFPDVSPDDIWAPSRRVASTPVRIADEREQFIFYRGLGAFDVPFRVVGRADGLLDVYNDSDQTIPHLFLMRVHQAGGALVDLGGVPAHGALHDVVPPVEGKERNLDQFVADAADRVAGALRDSGLYADEARAMVDTWTRSYFRGLGLRVLYVVPRAWTDRLLPLSLQPQPVELVRTLVGRVEVLTPYDEQQLVAAVRAASATIMPYAQLVDQLGRFAEPKLRRALELTADVGARGYCQSAIDYATRMP